MRLKFQFNRMVSAWDHRHFARSSWIWSAIIVVAFFLWKFSSLSSFDARLWASPLNLVVWILYGKFPLISVLNIIMSSVSRCQWQSNSTYPELWELDRVRSCYRVITSLKTKIYCIVIRNLKMYLFNIHFSSWLDLNVLTFRDYSTISIRLTINGMNIFGYQHNEQFREYTLRWLFFWPNIE